jgi:hypothetical protein
MAYGLQDVGLAPEWGMAPSPLATWERKMVRAVGFSAPGADSSKVHWHRRDSLAERSKHMRWKLLGNLQRCNRGAEQQDSSGDQTILRFSRL